MDEKKKVVCELCGGVMRPSGGRYAPSHLRHMMPVWECKRCGHAVDPRLVKEAGRL